jgi:hypothetical protein
VGGGSFLEGNKLQGLWIHLARHLFYFDFPKKHPLRLYDRMSKVVVSKVNVYQHTEGKSKHCISKMCLSIFLGIGIP